MKNSTIKSGAGILLALSLQTANAHSGGTDENGCHAGSQPYHCHNSGDSSDSYSDEPLFPEDFGFKVGHIANISTMAVMALIPASTINSLDSNIYSFSVFGLGAGWSGDLGLNTELYLSGHLSSLSESSMVLGANYRINDRFGLRGGVGYHVYVASYDVDSGELVENYGDIGLTAELGGLYSFEQFEVSTTLDFQQMRLWIDLHLPL